MGNFDDHLQYGHAAYILVALALLATVLLELITLGVATVLMAIALPATLGGAVFPDIDHHASKPHQAVRRAAFVAGTLGAFYVIYTRGTWVAEWLTTVDTPLPADATFGMLTLLAALLAGGISRFLVSYFRPPHRGITHRVPTGGVIAVALAAGGWYLTVAVAPAVAVPIAVTIGASFFVGFLSHLCCDRMLRAAAVGTLSRVIPRRS